MTLFSSACIRALLLGKLGMNATLSIAVEFRFVLSTREQNAELNYFENHRMTCTGCRIAKVSTHCHCLVFVNNTLTSCVATNTAAQVRVGHGVYCCGHSPRALLVQGDKQRRIVSEQSNITTIVVSRVLSVMLNCVHSE